MPLFGDISKIDDLIGRELREQLNAVLKEADVSSAIASINMDGVKVFSDAAIKSAAPSLHRQLLEAMRSAGSAAPTTDGKVVGEIQLAAQKKLMLQMDETMEKLTAVMSERTDLAQKVLQNMR